MEKVILDLNFLLVPFQLNIDIFEELEILLGKIDPIILSTTVQELNLLANKASFKIRKQIFAASELMRKCRIVNVKRMPEESYDQVIMRKAKQWKIIVATNDVKLRKKLRKAGITVIYVRQSTHLEIDGSNYKSNNKEII